MNVDKLFSAGALLSLNKINPEIPIDSLFFPAEWSKEDHKLQRNLHPEFHNTVVAFLLALIAFAKETKIKLPKPITHLIIAQVFLLSDFKSLKLK